MTDFETASTLQPTPVLDAFDRPLRSLRISLTDRCNLRCQYCMPEREYIWLRHEEILTFEELTELADIFTGLGVDKVRLTGGEPLLRRELDRLIGMLAQNSRIGDLALTTNGILLAAQARALYEAGLRRVTVSLDTLRPDRFQVLTRRDAHTQVLEGIAAARTVGFSKIKINTVVIRGFNEDELSDLIEFGREADAEVRFIEYMDVGGATRWSMDQVVPRRAILANLERCYGRIETIEDRDSENSRRSSSAPADRYSLPDGTVFGIIPSTTQPFCGTCDRARLTSDGLWLLCLYAKEGIDLKRLLRGGAGREEISQTISNAWRARTDRGAEERKALGSRGVLFRIEDLRSDPHREMHTRGG